MKTRKTSHLNASTMLIALEGTAATKKSLASTDNALSAVRNQHRKNTASMILIARRASAAICTTPMSENANLVKGRRKKILTECRPLKLIKQKRRFSQRHQDASTILTVLVATAAIRRSRAWTASAWSVVKIRPMPEEDPLVVTAISIVQALIVAGKISTTSPASVSTVVSKHY